jgi:glycoside/pentoside/hexuronide:cation symporter, GPH family
MNSHQTKASGTLSNWKRVAFGIGGASDGLMLNCVNSMAAQVLNICLAVNPALVSVAIFIPRLWDAFTDPVMGSISDNTRTRFGRRRPFILAGGLLTALMYIVLWRFPLVSSEIGYFLWFLIISLVYYSCYTVFSVPYNALSYELSPDYNERTGIMAFKCAFGAAAGLLVQWQFRLTQLDRFENTLDGMKTVSIGIAVLMAFGILFPALFLKERFTHEVSAQKKIRLIDSLKETLQNRAFRLLIIAVILICLGLYMVMQFGLYINVYHVYQGDKAGAATIMGIGGTVYHILGGILAAPLVSWVAGRFGKRKTLIGGLLLAMIGSLSKFVTFDPRWPYLQLLSMVLMAPGLSCLWILAPSMVADICDEDELEYGTRREGMFSAVYTNVLKIGGSIGLLIVGFLLNASGFKAELGVDQPPHTMLILRSFFAGVPALGLFGAALLIFRFPITAAQAAQTRQSLAARRGETAG